jgi:hypothetical protein
MKMYITIKIFYQGYSSRILQQASLPVNVYRFKSDPHQEAAYVAYEWFKEINRNMPFRAEIEKIIYNADGDITELVKHLDNSPK